MTSNIIITQMIIMALLMACGYFLTKYNHLSINGAQEITNILFKICTPAIMMNTFNMPFKVEVAKDFIKIFIISLLLLLISIAVSYLFYNKDSQRIEWFSSAFSNVGFIGIPLVSSIIGEEAVFYVSAFIIASSILMWTIGIFRLSKQRNLISLGHILRSPAIIGVFIGFIIFIMPFDLPYAISSAMKQITQINTVLAMIVLGHYIYTTPKSKIISMNGLKVSLVRLIIIPIASLILLYFIPLPKVIMSTLVIVVSTPCAVNTAMMSMKYGSDYEYGAGIVSLTTCLSVFTIPLIITLADLIL